MRCDECSAPAVERVVYVVNVAYGRTLGTAYACDGCCQGLLARFRVLGVEVVGLSDVA